MTLPSWWDRRNLVSVDETALPDAVGVLREAVEKVAAPSRERSLVLTKLEEAELWLIRCAPMGEPS